MLIRVLFKDPDGVYEAKKDTLGFDKKTGSTSSGIEMTLSKYISYDEYIEIEFDTENKTARVVPCR